MKESNHRLRLGLFAMVCILFAGSCNMSDDSHELSGEYFYHDEGMNDQDILSHLPDRKEIYPKVIDYNYNADFIIAVQVPDYDEFKSIIGFNLRGNLKKYPNNSSKERIESEKEADSILNHDPYYKLIFTHRINYWVIENKTHTVFGPLTKKEFEKKRTELNIPLNIRLKD